MVLGTPIVDLAIPAVEEQQQRIRKGQQLSWEPRKINSGAENTSSGSGTPAAGLRRNTSSRAGNNSSD
jgi:hypothetical protein